MPRAKGVKVWVVWERRDGGWRAMWIGNTRLAAREWARREYEEPRDLYSYCITSGTVMPPGVKP